MIPKDVQKKFDKLESDRKKLVQKLSIYSNDQLNKKNENGDWSPMQIIEHLIEAEAGSLKYMQKKLSFNPELETTGWKQSTRFLGFQMFFRSPIKVKAPKGVAEDLPDFSDFETTIERWEKERQILKIWLENTPDNLWDKCIFKHPVIGRLSIYHTLGFHDEHLRRHTKQINQRIGK